MSIDKVKRDIGKDEAMMKSKEIMDAYAQKIQSAKDNGKKVCYTFVPGNLVEILHCFDVIPIFPEVIGLQMGMRRMGDHYIELAENEGYPDDICSYVKSSVGMHLQDNVGPEGWKYPKPDFLFFIYSQCFTFMKWWEILRKTFDCPIITIQLPYRHHNMTTKEETKYGVDQFKKVIIPQMEKITGIKFDMDKLKEKLALSRQMEEDLGWVFKSGKNVPSPIDGMFQALYYVGPINTYYRGTQEGVDFYKYLRKIVEKRIEAKQGPPSPFGEMDEQKYRIVIECGITWDHFKEYSKILFDEKAITVASTYSKVSGLFDYEDFHHNPDEPFESMIRYNMTNYCNNSMLDRIQLMEDYIKEYKADGFLIGSIKSCKSFAAGQLTMLNELEKRTGMSGAFFETDMMDPRYFSEANVKTRIDSYFRMIDEKRKGGTLI